MSMESDGDGTTEGQDVKLVSVDQLPRPSTTYPAAIMEVVPGDDPEEESVILIIQTRNEAFGFPMSLKFALGLSQSIRGVVQTVQRSKPDGPPHLEVVKSKLITP